MRPAEFTGGARGYSPCGGTYHKRNWRRRALLGRCIRRFLTKCTRRRRSRLKNCGQRSMTLTRRTRQIGSVRPPAQTASTSRRSSSLRGLSNRQANLARLPRDATASGCPARRTPTRAGAGALRRAANRSGTMAGELASGRRLRYRDVDGRAPTRANLGYRRRRILRGPPPPAVCAVIHWVSSNEKCPHLAGRVHGIVSRSIQEAVRMFDRGQFRHSISHVSTDRFQRGNPARLAHRIEPVCVKGSCPYLVASIPLVDSGCHLIRGGVGPIVHCVDDAARRETR